MAKALPPTTTANIVAVNRQGELATPPRHKVLPGISLAALGDLAAAVGTPLVERDLRVDDLTAADEVLMTATSMCIMPVVRVNGLPIGRARPGPTFARLMSAWSELVGLDVVAQARQFARR